MISLKELINICAPRSGRLQGIPFSWRIGLPRVTCMGHGQSISDVTDLRHVLSKRLSSLTESLTLIPIESRLEGGGVNRQLT
jgi:hypothetical protein